MNTAQWRRHFEQQADRSASAVGMVSESLSAATAEFDRLLGAGTVDRELLRRHAQLALDSAQVQHGLTVKRLEALINLAALESRSGRQERAEAVRARFFHVAEASKATVDLWTDRLQRLGGYRDQTAVPN